MLRGFVDLLQVQMAHSHVGLGEHTVRKLLHDLLKLGQCLRKHQQFVIPLPFDKNGVIQFRKIGRLPGCQAPKRMAQISHFLLEA
ncbi:hypothetical protein D3C73_1511090 [compost metagenome]